MTDAKETPDNETPDNETMREVKRAKERKKAAAAEAPGIGWKAAAGIGIGSAALVAALMYAKSRKKEDD